MIIKNQNSFLFSLLVSLFFVSAPAFADVAPTAGQEENKFKEENKFAQEAPAVNGKDVVVRPVEEKIPDSYRNIKFTVTQVNFKGNESVKSEDLQKLAQPVLNKEINFARVLQLISDVKRHYRSQGYVAVYVYAPPQNIKEGGVLNIEIVEGKLGNLTITGNKHFSSSLIQKHITIEPNDPIRYQNFKSGLVRLNKHKDIDVKAVLKPGERTGTSDVELQVHDRSPWHLGVDANNLGTRDTGKYRFGTTLSNTNVFGNLEEASIRNQFGRDSNAWGADYNVPLDYRGKRLGIGYSQANIDVGGDFDALGIEGEARTFSPYYTQPLLERDDIELHFRTSFDFKNVENRTLGAVAGEDDLRILNAGIEIQQNDSQGQTFSPHTISLGIDDFLGGSEKLDANPVRIGTGGQFLIYQGSWIRYQRLQNEMLLSLRGTWQMTPDRLPSSEQIRLGGAHSVRGYQESEYLGDTGGFANVELFMPIYWMPNDWWLPWSKKPLKKQVQLVGFTDFGAAGIHKTLPGEKDSRSIWGAGFGFRTHLYDKLYARTEWGFPLGGAPADSRDSAFYFGVSYEIF